MHLGGGSSLLGLSSQSLILYSEICYQTWLVKGAFVTGKFVLETLQGASAVPYARFR